MTTSSTSPTLWGRLGLAVLSTAVLAIAHRAEAQPLLPVDDFHFTQTDTQVFEGNILVSLPVDHT